MQYGRVELLGIGCEGTYGKEHQIEVDDPTDGLYWCRQCGTTFTPRVLELLRKREKEDIRWQKPT